jgi:hypothetical protein
MIPEIIVNVWSFLQRYKGAELVYQLGIRLYAVSGSDDDKLDILRTLAPFDYHLASVFPLPESLSVQFGFPSEGGAILKGLIPVETVARKYKKLELFADIIDTVRQSLPENPLTREFKHAPYESLNFLYVNTPVEVDENGNMTARSIDPKLNQGDLHVAVNLWAFPEMNSTAIQALAGRAYLVAGDKIPIEAMLANLAVADYFLANRFALPASFSTPQNSPIISESTDLTAVTSQNDALFAPVLDQIEKEIPSKYVDWQKKQTRRYILPANISARRASIVREDKEGNNEYGIAAEIPHTEPNIAAHNTPKQDVDFPDAMGAAASPGRSEVPSTAVNQFTPDVVRKDGKLHFKCPTCSTTVIVSPQNIDPIIGVNVACSSCKNISHVPGGFKAESAPAGLRIAWGVRIPIAKFSDWYYENPVITSLIQKGQSDLLNDYGLWAFCGACYYQYPKTILTSLATSQSMAQRRAGGFEFSASTSGSAKDMEALRSGYCPQCGGKELIVIASEIPEYVRKVITKSKKNKTSVAANKGPMSIAGFLSAKANSIIIIVAIVILVASLYWVIHPSSGLSALSISKTQTGSPSSISTPIQSGSTSLPPSQQNQAGGICWTYELKNFSGSRFQVWDEILSDETKKLLQYNQFLIDVVLYNPQLNDDGYGFVKGKTYLIPELCP